MRKLQGRSRIQAGMMACLVLSATASAQSGAGLVELFSSDQPIYGYKPGGAASPPSISGEIVGLVVAREGTNNSSVVRWRIGTDEIHVVATENGQLPGGDGRFSSLNDSPSIDGSDVAFHAYTDHPSRGIFAELGGELERLSPLARFGRAPQVDQGRVLFVRANTLPYLEIFLRDSDGTIRTVAQSGDPAPDGSTFRSFSSVPMIEGDRVTFAASTQWDAGVYSL